MDEITQKVFIGNWSDALSLKQANPNGISSVLNVCECIDNNLPVFNYLHASFLDHNPIPKDIFDQCMTWLEMQYVNKESILIHCALGCSRSPTICAAFFAQQQIFKTLDEALSFIKIVRPQTNPAPEVLESARVLV